MYFVKWSTKIIYYLYPSIEYIEEDQTSEKINSKGDVEVSVDKENGNLWALFILQELQ